MLVGPSRVQGRISQRKLSLKEPGAWLGVHVNSECVGTPCCCLARQKPPNFLPTIHPPEFPLLANGLLGVERQEREGGSGDVPCPPLLKDYNSYLGGLIKQIRCSNTSLVSGKQWNGTIVFFFMRSGGGGNSQCFCHWMPWKGGNKQTTKGCLGLQVRVVWGPIGDSCTQPKASNAPRNEELLLQNVGAHIPGMRSCRGNYAVCSKSIRKSHKNEFKDVPKDCSPPVPYEPCPSIFCRVCNVFLWIQKDHNCCLDYHSKVEYWR